MDNNEFQELVLQELKSQRDSQREFQEKVFQKFEEIDKRLDTIDKRLDGIDSRLNRLEAKVSVLEEKVSVLESKVSALESKVSALEGRVSALETQWQETHLIVRGLREHNEILDAKLEALIVNTATVQSVNELRDAIQAMQEKQAKADRRMFALNRRLFLVEGEMETASANA